VTPEAEAELSETLQRVAADMQRLLEITRVQARRTTLVEEQLRELSHRLFMLDLTARQFFEDNRYNEHFLSRSGALAYYRASHRDSDADLPDYLTKGKSLRERQSEEESEIWSGEPEARFNT